MFIVPSDPLRPRRADPQFEPEATAAREAGLPVALVDHDALTRPDGVAEAVGRVPSGGGGDAVYRGWMLRSEQYAAFAAALHARGVELRTRPEQYRRAHELPGWYAELIGATPDSRWSVGPTRADFERCCVELGPGPAVLRDYTKSMKHYWHEAAFIPDVADLEGAWRVAARFLELREDAFVGGLVLRRFEELTTAEVRTWWVRGRCVLVDAHPDTPDHLPPPDVDPGALAPRVAALGLPFVTVDLALRRDGLWRVIEVGDGQVSDRPATLDPATFVTAVI